MENACIGHEIDGRSQLLSAGSRLAPCSNLGSSSSALTS